MSVRGTGAPGRSDPAAWQALPARIATWAKRQPDQPAVVHGQTTLSYGELYDRAGALAAVLRDRGVVRGTLVALVLPRTPELVIAALAVIMAGGAYVGLDVDEPAPRLSTMLADAGHPLTIVQNGQQGRFGTLGVETLSIQDSAGSTAAMDPVEVGPDDLCYVTYTSGSTGTPKGVLVPHDGVSNLVAWYVEEFEVGPGDRMAQLARPSFDGWGLEVWPCLGGGATLCVVESSRPDSPADFIAWLAARGVTVCFLTTALAVELFDQPWSAAGSSLRVMLVGGEKLHRHPPAGLPFRLFNVYGPTETTMLATCGEMPPDAPRDGAPPIGWPLPNMYAYVLDDEGGPVALGDTGVLHIGGTGVAHGYLNHPDLTAERFRTDPFNGGRMYITGDLVRQRPDGALDFVGRRDGQVKLRGFRIETGEVENALHRIEGVGEATVVMTLGGDRLVGYLVAADPARPPEPRQVRRELMDVLPDYMVPQSLVVLDTMPVTPHGKTDRAALASRTPPVVAGQRATPWHSDTERVLADLWREVLGITSVGRDDSFFDLGGDSLSAMRLARRAREAGIRLGAEDLFEHDVLHELAAAITNGAVTVGGGVRTGGQQGPA